MKYKELKKESEAIKDDLKCIQNCVETQNLSGASWILGRVDKYLSEHINDLEKKLVDSIEL